MRVVTDVSGPFEPALVTAACIGAFDGVHLGHRVLIGDVQRRAGELGVQSAVVTFDRHPAEVVRPESAPRLLTTIEQKLELLESTGVDLAVVIPFTEERASEPPDEFVRDVLVDVLGVRYVAVGEDFHFGARRQGNVLLLSEMGAQLGFEVLGHRLVGPDGRDALDEATVSSTAIRRALVEGRLHDANRMLGRLHAMRGPVVQGDQRGRDLGFPTANVAIGVRLLYPADGIYAGYLARADGERLPAAIYVGHRPTFYDDGSVVLEVHCLDWSGDLYGEVVDVQFVERLRGDQAFTSVPNLVRQLRVDCDAARIILSRDAS